MSNRIQEEYNSRKEPVRLNKYLSESGLCSRREADKLIESGRITVDGVRAEMIGGSYIKVDTEAWEKESEETGTMEFEVESMGGVPRKYLVTVEAYKPQFSFTYTWIPAE